MSVGMRSARTKPNPAQALIDAALRGELTQAQAQELYRLGAEMVTLALLAASKRIAELKGRPQAQPPDPSTPSGMVPVYTKPNAPPQRKQPGAKKGHPGHRRKRPDFAPGKFQSRVERLNRRLAALAGEEHVDADARRLTKRLRKYAEYIFTFLDYADVPFGRVEMWRGGIGWAYLFPPLSSGGASVAEP